MKKRQKVTVINQDIAPATLIHGKTIKVDRNFNVKHLDGSLKSFKKICQELQKNGRSGWKEKIN